MQEEKKIMEPGSNQAVLGGVYKKSEELDHEWDEGTTSVRYTVYFHIPGYFDEGHGELVVLPNMYEKLRLDGFYLFFFDWVGQGFAAVLKEFLPAEGHYDWVEKLGDSDKLAPERRQACKTLAARAQEAEKKYKEHVANGGCPF